MTTSTDTSETSAELDDIIIGIGISLATGTAWLVVEMVLCRYFQYFRTNAVTIMVAIAASSGATIPANILAERAMRLASEAISRVRSSRWSRLDEEEASRASTRRRNHSSAKSLDPNQVP